MYLFLDINFIMCCDSEKNERTDLYIYEYLRYLLYNDV